MIYSRWSWKADSVLSCHRVEAIQSIVNRQVTGYCLSELQYAMIMSRVQMRHNELSGFLDPALFCIGKSLLIHILAASNQSLCCLLRKTQQKRLHFIADSPIPIGWLWQVPEVLPTGLLPLFVLLMADLSRITSVYVPLLGPNIFPLFVSLFQRFISLNCHKKWYTCHYFWVIFC